MSNVTTRASVSKKSVMKKYETPKILNPDACERCVKFLGTDPHLVCVRVDGNSLCVRCRKHKSKCIMPPASVDREVAQLQAYASKYCSLEPRERTAAKKRGIRQLAFLLNKKCIRARATEARRNNTEGRTNALLEELVGHVARLVEVIRAASNVQIFEDVEGDGLDVVVPEMELGSEDEDDGLRDSPIPDDPPANPEVEEEAEADADADVDVEDPNIDGTGADDDVDI